MSSKIFSLKRSELKNHFALKGRLVKCLLYKTVSKVSKINHLFEQNWWLVYLIIVKYKN